MRFVEEEKMQLQDADGEVLTDVVRCGSAEQSMLLQLAADSQALAEVIRQLAECPCCAGWCAARATTTQTSGIVFRGAAAPTCWRPRRCSQARRFHSARQHSLLLRACSKSACCLLTVFPGAAFNAPWSLLDVPSRLILTYLVHAGKNFTCRDDATGELILTFATTLKTFFAGKTVGEITVSSKVRTAACGLTLMLLGLSVALLVPSSTDAHRAWVCPLLCFPSCASFSPLASHRWRPRTSTSSLVPS